MPSELIVPVVEISEIKPHNNADKLEIVTVLGYQCVVSKGAYKPGDKAIYYPVDVILPDDIIERTGTRNFLKGKQKNRVGCAKIRDENSYGFLERIENDDLMVGDNLAESLGVEKYTPPEKFTAADQAAYDSDIDPYFVKYNDIQNSRLNANGTNFAPDAVVSVTEKIHGSSCKVMWINGEVVCGSNNVRRKKPDDPSTDRYWRAYESPGIKDLFDCLSKDYDRFGVYGEIYGPGIQSLHYDISSPKFIAFDIMIEGEYVDQHYFFGIVNEFGIHHVPQIALTEYRDLDIPALANKSSIVAGNGQISEGVVIKLADDQGEHVNRWWSGRGRPIEKYISDDYMMSKHKQKEQ